MKLRIHGNSLRLRLNRTEVAELAQNGRVENALEFGQRAKLIYSVEAAQNLAEPRAAFFKGSISIQVPEAAVREWARTERVEISGEQPLRDGQRLAILIEKDFQCMHKESDDDADAYPNPLAVTN